MTLSSIKTGFATARSHKKIILIFYLFNLMFALALALPFRAVISRFVGNSLMGAALADGFDMNFFFDFLNKNQPFLSGYMPFVFFLAILYWLIMQFFTGGVLATFMGGDKYDRELFWAASAKYFPRFVRLILFMLPVGLILLALQFAITGVERLFWGDDPYEYITYWMDWGRVALRGAAILFFFIILDYAKIQIVDKDRKRVRRALGKSIVFSFKNFISTFAISLLLSLVGVAVLFFYTFLADALNFANLAGIIGVILLQQLYMAFRMFMKLTLLSSQVIFFNGRVR